MDDVSSADAANAEAIPIPLCRRRARGTARFNPFAINIRLDGICGEVVNGVAIFAAPYPECACKTTGFDFLRLRWRACGSGILPFWSRITRSLSLWPNSQYVPQSLAFVIGRVREYRTRFWQKYPTKGCGDN